MAPMRLRLCTLSMIAVAGWAGAGHAATLTEIKQRGYMVVGVAAESSPFGTVANGKRTGFDQALLDRFRRSVPFAIREKILPTASLVASLGNGEIDAIASSIEITPDRQKAVEFAPPVAETTLYYLKRRGDDRIRSVGDLGTRPLGIREGSESFLAMSEVEHQLAKLGKPLGQIVDYKSDAEAYRGLTDRHVDGVVGDIADLAEVAKQQPALFAVGQPVAHETYVAWGVAKDNADLANLLSVFAFQERKNGDLVALQQKWLGWTFPKLPDSVTAQDWWTSRTDRPAEFPIPTLRDPD